MRDRSRLAVPSCVHEVILVSSSAPGTGRPATAAGRPAVAARR